MNTPSPTPFSSNGQTIVPWTGLSLTVAVSWMLFLAFTPLAPGDPAPLEEETARVYEPIGLAVATGIFIATKQPPLAPWSLRAELAASDSDTDE